MKSEDPQGTVTRLLVEIADGKKDSEKELFDLVYHEIHLAAARLMARERKGHTWQPTDFVGEVYLRLFSKGIFNAPNRAYFFGSVARAMRQALIDHSRKRRPEHVALDEVLNWFHTEQRVELFDLNQALDELERLHPRHHRVVMQKIFLGRTMDDIAEDEKVSKSTSEKDWMFARAWLRQRLEEGARGS